jgi:thioredoxin-dependent peroxiredoxin
MLAWIPVRSRLICVTLILSTIGQGCGVAVGAPPKVGDAAIDFTLADPKGQSVKLSTVNKQGPVVLVVLRGHPGYQCPLCTRQVGEIIAQGGKFREAGATVLFVYPGPAKELDKHAKEFLANTELPEGFTLLLDPDYKFTNAWKLRWNAANETAYPSTFVLAKGGAIRFAKVSQSHGDRTGPAEILKALAK